MSVFLLLFRVAATLILVPALYFTGGAIGLVAGLILGGAIDFLRYQGAQMPDPAAPKPRKKLSAEEEKINDFVVSALLLSAAVIKADGTMDEQEVGYLRRFLADQFGEACSLEYMAVIRQAYQQNFNLKACAEKIKKTSDYETRLQLLYIIFGIAKSNFDVDAREKTLIDTIAEILEIDRHDFESVRAMFSFDMDAYYRILELTPSASDGEVKAAYRALSKKFHPDKVAHLGEMLNATAQKKYEKVREAYDAIRHSRGF